MTCPVCQRELAPTLSICYACGTMVQDSVREELAGKIGRVSKPLAIKIVTDIEEKRMAPERTPDVIAFAEQEPIAAVPNLPVIERRPKGDPTERISRHTSPTLVGFQNPKSNVPDWRLHLQNSIRQRKAEPVAEQPLIPGLHTHLVTNGNAALKAQYIPEPEPETASNPRLENALKRIEDSRRKFLGESAQASKPAPAAKNYPFNVVEGSGSGAATGVKPATVNSIPKPRLVSTTSVNARRGLDTNKLPPIADVAPAQVIAVPASVEPPRIAEPVFEPIKIEIAAPEPVIAEREVQTIAAEAEEIDDLAPMSTRVTAGLFDTIIAGFATAILMSPLFISGGEWLSISGIIAIVAAFGIVMFTYLTVGVGLRGRTLGMKIFSLEVIDIEANEYPTFHQAAVRSAVFLLSLPLLGIGLLPAFFNDERRAAHDLVSGTILVREL